MEFSEPTFSKSPKRFYPINMAFVVNKLVRSMVDPIMLFVTQIYQAIISSPAVRMNDAVRVDSSANNSLQRVDLAQSGTTSV